MIFGLYLINLKLSYLLHAKIVKSYDKTKEIDV